MVKAMHDKYKQWIASLYLTSGGYGQCSSVTQSMVEAFPELTRVRGHYYCSVWGERAHWWCIDTGGNIVDPTAAQFPSKGCGEYVPWTEGTQEPTGLCMNCGAYCYDSHNACSERCERELYAEYGVAF